MLFAISFILFAIYVAISIRNKSLRWIGWVLFAVYFLVLVLFGDLLRSVFDMEEGSRTFFIFIAVIYTALPLALAEGTARLLGSKKRI